MSREQIDIFGNEVSEREMFMKICNARKRYKSMQSLYGFKEGHQCKTCKYCELHRYHNKNYYKCALWHISNSSATDIRIIVQENVVQSAFDEETCEVIKKIISTVGVRLKAGDQMYGEYVVYNKPTLQVSDVVEAANEILDRLIKHSQKYTEANDEEKS